MPKEFDFANPPFDRLSAREWSKVRDSLDVAFYRAGTTMLRAGDEPEHLYVVIKGVVEERDGDEIVTIHGPKDSFDSKAVIEGRARADFVVQEEAICYVLPRGVVRALADANPAFAAFLYRDISRRLEALATREGGAELQALMAARVRQAFIRPPVYIDGGATVVDSAALMRASNARSTLVRDGGRVGIVTAGSLAGRVILDKVPLETRLRDLARFDLVAVDADDFVFDALLAMTRHGIQRVVVRDAGAIVGTLDQVDVLSFLAHQSHIVAGEIDRAATTEALHRASDGIVEQVKVLQRNGVGYPLIARLVSELNRRLFARLYALVAPPEMVANSCLIVMGSDGRGEQVLRADQDNGLILRDGVAFPELERVRADFTRTLNDFGYPPCDGKVMVDNPAWSKPLAAFRDSLKHWILMPAEDSALNLAIFCDSAAVAGDATLLADARAYMVSLLSDNPGFFQRFAEAIDAFDVPIGTFWRLFGASDGVDVKKVGLFPIVHGVRSLALLLKLPETNTLERIRKLEDHGALDPALAKELTEAFVFFQGLRLRSRLAKTAAGTRVDNLVEPGRLGTLERDLLKDSLAIVKQLKSRVHARVSRHGL
jgi:CBS domain-containing protein